MRSIRRSLTLYLFALLAVTLAVVWLVIDQVTAHALAAREEAVSNLLQAQYEQRCHEERARVDKALLDQAKLLGNILQKEYGVWLNHEMVKFRAATTVQFGFGPILSGSNPLGQAALAATWYNPGTFREPNPLPGLLARPYFANLPIPDELIRHLEEGLESDYFQVNTPAGREWRSASLGPRKLPFDAKEIDAKQGDPAKPAEGVNVVDWRPGNATLGPEHESVRRVLYKMPHVNTGRGGRGPGFGAPPPGRDDRKDDRPAPPPWPGGFAFGNPSRSMLGTYSAFIMAGLPPPAPMADSFPRLYIQCARPQAAIDATLARFAAERDDELAALASEIALARSSLRLDLTTIALVAFLALAVGAPILVGRGLRPVGELSDAVSRVSEKDFKLTHDGTDLAVELAPIHARLTQTLDLLRRAFSREKQAVADISHELRTPIAALLATIDVALRKPRTPEQYREALEECRLISKQLGQLVERIMTLASLDAGNDRLMLSRTDAGELASGCAAVIRSLAAANGVAVEVQAEEMLDIETDAGKLREVLMNLLHNAIEYNKPDGSIQLTARRVADDIVFEVRDTGIGMTPEVKEKIFERFYRADTSRHATGVHAGLGLAIVKEYVARINGTIAVESEPGVGSTFRVTLPAPAAPPGEPGDTRTADVPVTAGA